MPDTPTVIVTPPPPTISPGNYMGGAGAVTVLAGALRVIEPAWTLDQAMYIATLFIMTLGGVHMLLAWWIAWKYPTAPPLPSVLDQLRRPVP